MNSALTVQSVVLICAFCICLVWLSCSTETSQLFAAETSDAATAESAVLLQRARSALETGQLRNAEQLARKALRVERETKSQSESRLEAAIECLAEILRQRGARLMQKEEYDSAAVVWTEVQTLRSELRGPQHWWPGNAGRARESCEFMKSLTITQRQGIKHLDSLQSQVHPLRNAGHYQDALALCLQLRDGRIELYGPTHFVVADACLQCAEFHDLLDNEVDARESLESSLKICRATLEEFHPQTALCLTRLAQLSERRGRYVRAAELYAQCAACLKQAYHRPHIQLAAALHNQARMTSAAKESDKATHLYQESIAIYEQLSGNEQSETALAWYNQGLHYQTNHQLALAQKSFERSLTLRRTIAGNRHPDTIVSLHSVAEVCREQDDFRQALTLHRECLQTRTTVYGAESAEVADSLRCLGLAQIAATDYDGAEESLMRAVELFEKAHGQQHSATAAAVHAVGLLSESQGETDQAIAHYRTALQVRTQVLGETHADTAESHFELSQILQSQAKYAEAFQHARLSLSARLAVLGDRHPDVARTLNVVAQLADAQGQSRIAGGYYSVCLHVWQQIVGEKHVDTATASCNLGIYYLSHGDFDAAQPLLEQSLKVRLELCGDEHVDTANSYHNLGLLHFVREDYSRAIELLGMGLQIHQRVHGRDHASTASSLFNLGGVRERQGHLEQAAEFMQECLSIRSKVLGEEHPDTSEAVSSLASIRLHQGDLATASSLFRRRLKSGRRFFDSNAVFQSDQQQLEMAGQQKNVLDIFVSLAQLAPEVRTPAWHEVLHWKGATLMRQRRMRHVVDDPRSTELFAQLQGNSRRLLRHSRQTVSHEDIDRWSGKLLALREERDALESALSQRASRFGPPTSPVTADDIRRALPSDATLVTFFDYKRLVWPDFAQLPEEHQVVPSLGAFLCSADGTVVLLDLGAIEHTTNDVSIWRRTLGSGEQAAEAALDLRRRIWEPIEAHVDQEDLILVSPDGPLEQFPLAALPGVNPGTYLLEEYRIVTLPVPRLLPELVAAADGEQPSPRLLVVGDVDYDGASSAQPAPNLAWRQPSASIQRGGDEHFSHLPGTVGEIAVIRSVFQERVAAAPDDLMALTGIDAGEDQFCAAAAEYTHLHLATHGFFRSHQEQPADGGRGSNPQDGRQMQSQIVDSFTPGLESGLVFSGANQPPAPDRDDGILTAADIAALKLDGVDLAVLSACESGLGKSVGGEGMLGVQRAFQVAGAQTTIASLWPVSDVATQLLMERFYRNLWQGRMSKLDALREAQLHLLNHPQEVLSHDSFRGDRRVRPGQSNKASHRLAPQFWAAFSLSGAWE